MTCVIILVSFTLYLKPKRWFYKYLQYSVLTKDFRTKVRTSIISKKAIIWNHTNTHYK